MRTDTLYISDLDGTLLGTDSRVSERSAAIISDLTALGANITVATARTPATVVPLLANTRTSTDAIVMTGCAYWKRKEGRFFAPHFLPEEELLSALAFCRSHGVTPFVYVMAEDMSSLDVYHAASTMNSAEEAFWLERRGLALKRFHLGSLAPVRALACTMLLYAMGPEECIRRAADDFSKTTTCTVQAYPDIFNPRVWNFEVFPPGITKARAASLLGEHIGTRRTVAFGDSINDLPLLAAADVAVAVGNALPQVKEAADIVIEPNYTDSVARFILNDN